MIQSTLGLRVCTAIHKDGISEEDAPKSPQGGNVVLMVVRSLSGGNALGTAAVPLYGPHRYGSAAVAMLAAACGDRVSRSTRHVPDAALGSAPPGRAWGTGIGNSGE